MPFIGQQPQTGAYHKLDSITTSATATYNLQLNGGAYYPTSANHLLVSLNGVMQAPQDSFTVSGSQITFASALTSSDSIDFIMALGDVLDIGVPSDGAVNTSQLANSAVTTAKINDGAITSGKLAGLAVGDLPSGSIVQTAQSVFTGGTSNNSTTFADTGHSLAFTPVLANSKIRVELQGGGWYDEGFSMQIMWISFQSNETGSYTHLTGINTTYGLIRMSGSGDTWNIKPYSASWYYTPSYTLGDTITYRVVYKVSGNSAQYSGGDRGDPVLTVTEYVG